MKQFYITYKGTVKEFKEYINWICNDLSLSTDKVYRTMGEFRDNKSILDEMKK